MVKNKKEKYSHGEEFSKKVGIKESRRIKARQKKGFSILYGLSMFGMVGWSVTIPTIILTLIGIWLDREWPGRFSWTLTLIVIGVILGCLNAWYWVRKESRGD
ncbi:MAG: AtpZ/AtpI family protein [Candidatus Jettenia caeni]|nr:AtpZ/AtpI family protein [Candidatus Jettenia caeni]